MIAKEIGILQTTRLEKLGIYNAVCLQSKHQYSYIDFKYSDFYFTRRNRTGALSLRFPRAFSIVDYVAFSLHHLRCCSAISFFMYLIGQVFFWIPQNHISYRLRVFLYLFTLSGMLVWMVLLGKSHELQFTKLRGDCVVHFYLIFETLIVLNLITPFLDYSS